MSKKKIIIKPDGTEVHQYKISKFGKHEMKTYGKYSGKDYPNFRTAVAADNLGFNHGYYHTKEGKKSTKKYVDKRAENVANVNNVLFSDVYTPYTTGYRAGKSLAMKELKGKHARKISASGHVKSALKAKDVGVSIKVK